MITSFTMGLPDGIYLGTKSITIAGEGNEWGLWHHMVWSLCFIMVHLSLHRDLKIQLDFYSVVLCSQAGEGAPEEGCGADEASGPQLQTRSGGFTGKSNLETWEKLLDVLFACAFSRPSPGDG